MMSRVEKLSYCNAISPLWLCSSHHRIGLRGWSGNRKLEIHDYHSSRLPHVVIAGWVERKMDYWITLPNFSNFLDKVVRGLCDAGGIVLI